MRQKSLLPILAALLVALSGCGMFSTRPAEPPGGGGPVVPPNFTTIDSTLATIVRAIHDRSTTNFTTIDSTLATIVRAIHDRSTTNFGLALADTLLENREFHAVFDPADIIEWTSAGHPAPTDWRRNDELTLFPQFVANFPDQLYDTYFFVDEDRGGKINIGGPTQMEIWNMHYRVWAGSIPVAAGSAGLTFERVGLGSEYKLTYWDDHRDTTNVRSWGKHRLEGR